MLLHIFPNTHWSSLQILIDLGFEKKSKKKITKSSKGQITAEAELDGTQVS